MSWAPSRSRLRPHKIGWRAVPREFVLVAVSVVFYFGVRGLTVTNTIQAREHAHAIVAFERRLHVYVEPSIQDVISDSRHLTTLVNWIYIWGHWPVITLTLLWLVMRHPDGYRVTRNAMLLSGLVGLIVFATYPVAPPRLADIGLLDTVTRYSTAYRWLQPPMFVNQYAAVPSLHVGWDLLMGIALFTYSSHVVIRVIGVLLPALMAFAVIATANHYLLDVALGVALVLLALVAARRFEGRPRGVPDIPAPRAPAPADTSDRPRVPSAGYPATGEQATGPDARDRAPLGQHGRGTA
ncbi:MAG: phosphatase PAP2 family protein [Actinomycetes bacterium]